MAREHWVENLGQHPSSRHAAAAWERGEYRPPPAFVRVEDGRLRALKVNPYWFPHGIYAPSSPAEGGPLTIGRVIHMGRSNGFVGAVGGAAIFRRALTPGEMKSLSSAGG